MGFRGKQGVMTCCGSEAHFTPLMPEEPKIKAL